MLEYDETMMKNGQIGCVERLRIAAVYHQADNRLPAMRLQSLIPLSFPTHSLCSACGQAGSALHAAAVERTLTGQVDWTGLGVL